MQFSFLMAFLKKTVIEQLNSCWFILSVFRNNGKWTLFQLVFSAVALKSLSGIIRVCKTKAKCLAPCVINNPCCLCCFCAQCSVLEHCGSGQRWHLQETEVATTNGSLKIVWPPTRPGWGSVFHSAFHLVDGPWLMNKSHAYVIKRCFIHKHMNYGFL